MDYPLLHDRYHSNDGTAHCHPLPSAFAVSALQEDRSTPSLMEELAHEVRQPLSVIESLAYYLEITSTDEKTRAHLQRIQAMVLQANLILKRTCRLQANAAAAE